MILWLVLLESGCAEIWEAGVCVGGVFDEGVVGGRWVGIAILVGVHGRGQEAKRMAMAA